IAGLRVHRLERPGRLCRSVRGAGVNRAGGLRGGVVTELLRHRAGTPPVREVAKPRHALTAALFIVAALLVPTAYAQSHTPATPPVQAFESATRDYVRMHRRLESQVGAIHLNITVAELN